MKKLVLLFLIFIVSCSSDRQNISEGQVKSVIEGFFYALDIENRDQDMLPNYVTDDFLIYEASEKMDLTQFKDFISGSTEISTDWKLDDYRITIDQNTAHASFYNKGTFINKSDTSTIQTDVEWLESAFLVMERDSLKIKFYFSDNVKRESNTL
jgi:hypothetical protein